MVRTGLFWVFAAIFSTSAHADVYVSTADKLLCDSIRQGLQLSAAKAPCAALDDQAVEAAKNSNRYQYHAIAHRGDNGTTYVTIENWARKDEADWQRAGWRFDTTTDEEEGPWVRKRVADFKATIALQKPIRDAAFMMAAVTSKKIKVNPETSKCYDRETNAEINCDQAEVIFLEEQPRNKQYMSAVTEMSANLGLGSRAYKYILEHRHVRTSMEIGTMLLVGWGLYWVLVDLNRADFDFDWSGERLAKKWGSLNGIRFDNNKWVINMGHAPTGAEYYLIARVNNSNVLESFLISVAASFLWETLVEYREVLSINDMITTPVGGMAIGEALYQLGELFSHSKDTLLNRILASVFSNPTAIDRWVYKNKPKHAVDLDAHGFTREVFHNIRLFAGGGATTIGSTDLNPGTRAEAEIGINSEIITVPEYEKPETVHGRLLVDGNFTQLVVKSAMGAEGLNKFLFFTKASLIGHYQQSLHLDKAGQLEGYSFFVGASTAFDASIQKSDGFTDELGIINVVGPTIDTAFYYKGFRIRAVIDVFGDFATIRSYAIDEYAMDHDINGVKSILKNEQNYFGYGLTADARIVINKGSVEVGGEIKFDMFESIEGRDRQQAMVTNDLHTSDSRRRITVWGTVRIPKTSWRLGVSLEDLYREGTAGAATVKRSDQRITGYAIYEF